MRALALLLVSIGAQFSLLFGQAQAHVGTGIDVDYEDRVYFVDTLHNRIWRLDPDGKLTAMAENMHLDFLIIGEDGDLYLIKEGVWKLTRQGQLMEVVLPTDTPKAIGRPFAVDRHGDIYFTNGNISLRGESQIYRRTPEGTVTLMAGSEWGHRDGKGPEAKLGRVNSAAWGPDGSLYVLDEEQRIRKVDREGTVSTLAHSEEACQAEGGEERLVRTMGLAVDVESNLYVANYWQRRVFKLTSDGRISTVLDSSWPWVPVGVAVTGGDVYVIERMGNPYGPTTLLQVSTLEDRLGSPRVRKVTPDGTIVTLAVVEGERGLFIIAAPFIVVVLAMFVWRVRKHKSVRRVSC